MGDRYEYSYTICDQFAPDLFQKQCVALEKHIPGLLKGDSLQDVDGTSIQRYQLGGQNLVVVNDYEIGALYIESDFNIEPYF